MKMKRYVVRALPEAMSIIRNELGADAIILNTKEIKVGGFMGLFGKKRMEVIAAVETDNEASLAAAASAAGKKGKPPARSYAAPGSASPAGHPAPGGKASAAAVAEAEAPAALKPAVPQAAAAKAFAASYGQAASEKPAALRLAESVRPAAPVLAPPAPAAAEKSQPPASGQDAVLNELRDMKRWMVQLSKNMQDVQRHPAVLALEQRLTGQEVAAELVERIVAKVEERLAESPAEPGSIQQEAVWQLAEAELNEWLEELQDEGIASSTRMIYFVGPTGVGKTTSIAKLAAEQSLHKNRRVGFITADTYRIAAVDQLRTYATILDLPLEVVFSPAEVSRAVKELSGCDLILMDTAGRNFRNELFVSEVNSLMCTKEQAETYLVLSLTSKLNDMELIAGRFVKYGVSKAIYTKQDETAACGAILNLAMLQGIRPVYLANGQTVPDDIAKFDAGRYVKRLLGDVDQ